MRAAGRRASPLGAGEGARSALHFTDRDPKALKGPLTGQVLWASLLVPHFVGLLPHVLGWRWEVVLVLALL